MEEILVTQRVNWASIEILKNYSMLSEKRKLEKLLNKPDTYDDGHIRLQMSINQWSHLNIKKNTIFFQFTDEKVNLYSPQESRKTYYTTKDRTIKRYLGNPFASVQLSLVVKEVKLKGNKLIIHLYNQTKRRGNFFRYFKKTGSSTTISIDLKTGNFNVIERLNKSKTYRTNNFQYLYSALDKIFKTRSDLHPSELINKLHAENFKDFVLYEQIYKTLNIQGLHTLDNLKTVLLKFFVDKRQIKIPDNFEYFLIKFYPTEKFLKKNDRKLIQSILDAVGLKSKLMIKLLHQYPFIDLSVLVNLKKLFGDQYQNYLSLINHNLFSIGEFKFNPNGLPTSGNLNDIRSQIIANDNITYDLLTDKDRLTVCRMINSMKLDLRLNANLIFDHVRMLCEIRVYYPNINMNAKTLEEFNEEHTFFTGIKQKIRKGFIIELEYKEEMVENVQKEIKNEETGLVLHPYILKNEEEYIEEGVFMHHCVGGYVDKDTSIIISLRTEDKKNRVTCEFNIKNGYCIQVRHFCNGPVPPEFEYSLNQLKERVEKQSEYNNLKQIGKRRVSILPELEFPTDNDLFGSLRLTLF